MIDNFKKTDKNNTDNKAQTHKNTGMMKLDMDELDMVSGGYILNSNGCRSPF